MTQEFLCSVFVCARTTSGADFFRDAVGLFPVDYFPAFLTATFFFPADRLLPDFFFATFVLPALPTVPADLFTVETFFTVFLFGMAFLLDVALAAAFFRPVFFFTLFSWEFPPEKIWSQPATNFFEAPV